MRCATQPPQRKPVELQVSECCVGFCPTDVQLHGTSHCAATGASNQQESLSSVPLVGASNPTPLPCPAPERSPTQQFWFPSCINSFALLVRPALKDLGPSYQVQQPPHPPQIQSTDSHMSQLFCKPMLVCDNSNLSPLQHLLRCGCTSCFSVDSAHSNLFCLGSLVFAVISMKQNLSFFPPTLCQNKILSFDDPIILAAIFSLLIQCHC